MAKQDINIGTNANDGSGDNPRAAASKINSNFSEVYASIPAPSAIVPLVDGTAAVGSSTAYARANHVHPTDTSRAATSHTHAGTDIVSGIVPTARLGSGIASSATYLRGDSTWGTPGGGAASVDIVYYPQTYGAIGDGNFHPLSSVYSTLAAAQAVYPFATSLTQEIDGCAIQKAINEASSKSSGGCVVIPNTGMWYKVNFGIVLNPLIITIRGTGSILDFSQVGANTKCITFFHNSGDIYGHSKSAVSGIEIVGPGRTVPGVTGIFYNTGTAAEGRSSRGIIRDVSMREFNVALELGNNAYCIHHDHVSIWQCALIFKCWWDLNNSGEQITFSNCTFFNSDSVFENRGAAHISCVGCSFDYVGKITAPNSGIIDFTSCRFEISPPSEIMFTCWGSGSISIFGGFFLVNGDEAATTAPSMFFMADVSVAHIYSLFSYHTKPANGSFASGPGKVYLYNQRRIVDSSFDVLRDSLDGTQSNSVPSTGINIVGDFVRNSNPSELGSAGSKYIIHGWTCVTAGSPGVWIQNRSLTGN